MTRSDVKIRHIVRFALVGATSFVINVLLTYALTEFFHWWYFWSFLFSTLLCWTFIFVANMAYTFEAHAPLAVQIKRYWQFIMGYLGLFWVNAGIVFMGTSLFGLPYIISMFVGAAGTTVLTFLFNRFVIFYEN